MNRMTMKIGGMSCGHCVSRVASALERLDGVRVEQVEVGAATAAYDPAVTTEAHLARAIEDQGYTVVGTTHA
jgi:copper chaperone